MKKALFGALFLLVWFFCFVLVRWCWLLYFFGHSWFAGGSPAASYLFCFAKKGNPKKATAQPLPFGFPFVQIKKWEANEIRCAQTAFTSFPFSAPHKRQRHSGLTSTAVQRQQHWHETIKKLLSDQGCRGCGCGCGCF